MDIQFNDLLDFCFEDLPASKQTAVAMKILTDHDTFFIIRGLNLLKKELGTKEKVQDYFKQNADSVKERFFQTTAG